MDGWRVVDISSALGCPHTAVKSVLYKDAYSSLRDEYDYDNRPRKKESVSDEAIIKLCKLLEFGGYTAEQIKEETGISLSLIDKIKNRERYKTISKSFQF